MFLSTMLGTIAVAAEPVPDELLRISLDGASAYRLRAPETAEDAVSLQQVAIDDPQTGESQPVSGIGDTSFEGNPIPWQVINGAFHYVMVSREPTPPANYRTGIVMTTPAALARYRNAIPKRAIRWSAPEERLCTIHQLAAKYRAISDAQKEAVFFDFVVEEPGRYSVYVQAGGKMEVWEFDMRAEKVADRTDRLVAEFASSIPGPFRVFDAKDKRYLLDSQGLLYLLRTDGAEMIGEFRTFGRMRDNPRVQLVFVLDSVRPFVALMAIDGVEVHSLEYTVKNVEFNNPMLEGEISAQQKKAIQALLAPTPPPQELPQATAPASQPAN